MWKCHLTSEKISLQFLWAGSDSKNISICHLYPSGMDASFLPRDIQSVTCWCPPCPIFQLHLQECCVRDSVTLSTSHLSYFMACIVIFAQSNIALSHISYPYRSLTSPFPLPRNIWKANSTYLLITTSAELILLVIDLMNRVPTVVKYHSRLWR